MKASTKQVAACVMPLIFIALVVAAVTCLWNYHEYHWYSGFVPAQIGISSAIEISGHSGLREGCGAAIFEMDRKTQRAILDQGMGYFDTGWSGRRSHTYYDTYVAWHPTPAHVTEAQKKRHFSLLTGYWCSDANGELGSRIHRAMDAPGSYYTFGPEKFLLVAPNERLVVFTYNG